MQVVSTQPHSQNLKETQKSILYLNFYDSQTNLPCSLPIMCGNIKFA